MDDSAFDALGATPVEAQASPQVKDSDFDVLGASPTTNPQPDMSPIKKVFKDNLKEARSNGEGEAPKENSYYDDFMAGWGQSTTGMVIHGGLPDKVLPEDAGRLARIISQTGTFVGDLPAMAAGFIGGAKAGGSRGGMVGAFALPPAIRQILVDHYQKGDIKDFGDFYDRASATLHEAIKGGATGLAVSYVSPLAKMGMEALGEAAPKALAPIVKSGLAKFAGMTAAEAATMTTVGSALDGKVPSFQDFLDNATFITLFHGAKAGFDSVMRPDAAKQVGGKLMDIYAKTGVEPHQVSDLASQDEVLRQEIMSKDDAVPSSLKRATQVPENHVEINPNPELTKPVDGISTTAEKETPGKLMVRPLDQIEPPKGEPRDGELPEHVKKVLSRIGEQPEPEVKKIDANKIYENVFDAKDPLKQMTKALRGEGAIGSKDDPYGLARSFSSVARKADYMLDFGPREFDNPLNKTGTPGLTKIWDQVADKDQYTAFQMAKHALDMDKLGLKSGIDLDAAKQTVKDLEPTYGKIAKQEVQFGNDGLKYLKDSGVISKEAFDTMVKKWPNHISMARIMDEAEEVRAQGSSKSMTPSNPIKAFTEEGSERQIENPLESRVKDFHKMIAMAERNRISSGVADMIDQAIEKGDKSWGNVAKKSIESIDVHPEEIQKGLVKQGMDQATAQKFADAITVFRKASEPLADDQIAVYRDGKRVVYENVPENVVNVMRDLNPGQASILVKALSGPSKGLRFGMLNSPAFAIRHFFRQEALATALTPGAHLPVLETIKGLVGMAGPDFGDWVMHGGGGDTIAGIDNDYIKSKLFELNEKTQDTDMQWNKVKNGVQFIKHGIELTDEARTFQKFRNAMDRGLDPWQAQFEARDTTIDVQRSGAKMQAYASLDPFQNIRIQGLDLIARRIKEDPKTVIPKLMATITIPSVLLWWANHDKKWYQELNPQDRDMNWHFSVGDPENGGHVVRVPKPFEPGVVFGSLPERLMDKYMDERPDAMAEFGKTLKDAVMPGYIPTIAQPMFEQWANKSFLTDSPLIPHNLEGKNPDLQSRGYTSDSAKIIAAAIRQIPMDFAQKPGGLGSPIVIDNYIRDWTGGVGQLVNSTLDAALEKSGLADKMGIDYNHNPPESVWADNPFLKSFVNRYPSTNTRDVSRFYERAQNIKVQQDSLSYLMKNLKPEQARAQAMKMMDTGTMIKVQGVQQMITEQMNAIDKITELPGMDPATKRQLIDKLAIGVNKTAEQGNKLMDSVEKMSKDRAKAASGF